MSCLNILNILVPFLSFSVEATSGEVVTGSMNGRLTLPCANQNYICWERGGCSFSQTCNNGIIWIDGQKVTSRKPDRYQLLGSFIQGDMSLTITGVTQEDEGKYCCRMGTDSPFGNKKEVEVKITEAVGATSGEVVTGSVNGSLTLPCTYQNLICWGRGSCFSFAKCNNAIIRIDGQIMTSKDPDRYQLLGNLSQGDVSLTITGVTKEEEGKYCCRVEINSFFGKSKENEVEVKIRAGEVVTGSVNGSLTLPCGYRNSICWERGGCSLSFPKCNNAIIRNDGTRVNSKKPDKYQLLGDISQGDVSLTIIRVTKEDEGKYCCYMEIDLPISKVWHEVEVKLTEDSEVRELPTIRSKTITDSSTTKVMVVTNSLDVGGQKTASIGNIIRGILIFLLPPLFLLIYKCCSL